MAIAPPSSSILLFDGVCNLCTGLVTFIIDRDPAGQFLFASMQSPQGQEVLRRYSLPLEGYETFALIENGRLTTRSTAALRIARKLHGLWPLLYALIVIPTPLRDSLYSLVARNRYRLFGKRHACMIPTEDLRRRFLC